MSRRISKSLARNKLRQVAASPLARYITFATILAALVDLAFYTPLTQGNPAAYIVWGGFRMYTPTAAVLLAAGIKAIKDALHIDTKSALLYFTSPLVAYLALAFYFLLAAPLGATAALSPQMSVLALAGGYIAAITINALLALGEEVGWRGFLQPRLEAAGLSLAKAAFLTGVVWGFWHAPAILMFGHNYPENRLLGVFLFPLLTAAVSYPLAVVRKLSSSAFPCASLHGAINALWRLAILAPALPREVGALGPLAIAAWLLTSAAIRLLAR
ncbi:MAG: type II CAAX prenyl endopeptidase Rce1 family protein [Pyrobaculum sp.]